ncbi:MAG: type II secretion system protein [Pirellulaceae bacterium]
MKRSFRKAGFTLLEVLMVVAMLAIVGGAIITSYGGLEDKAAKGAATHTIAAVTEAFLVYESTEGGIPNNLESLLAATPSGNTYDNTIPDNVATGGDDWAQAGNLGYKIAGKGTIDALTADEEAALIASGIDKIRYMETAGNGDGAAGVLKAVGGVDVGTYGALSAITIPQHAFSVPRGANKNRGRGFALDLNAAGQPSVYVWDAGTDGYNNVKIGGGATIASRLVCLGLGNESNLIGSGVFVNLQHAPYYGNVAKNEYNHYIALIDVSVNPAKLRAVLDSRGDFLDEEFAEATGQKP